MAVVVGAPDVDHPVKAPLFKLVAVVGNVGGKVGVEAVGPAQHIVLQLQLVDIRLLFSVFQHMLGDDPGGSEPKGPVLFISIAPVGEQLHGLRHIAALMQLRLEKPLVVLNAVAAQVGLHLGDVPVQTEAGHGLVAGLQVLLQVFLAVSVVESLCQLPDIVAVVAVLGEFHLVLAQNQLLIAGVDGGGKFFDLIAGVVHIELTPDLIAGPV